MHRATFYFDFVSPYTWLALRQAEGFARRHDLDWELRPVVYAKLLEVNGLLGPAETPHKRRYTFHDISRAATLLKLNFVGPPAHPFRSLEALRCAVLFGSSPQLPKLCVQLAAACWEEGRDLTDLAVLRSIVEGRGLDADALESRIATPEVKQTLHRNTAEALERGAFGVPTFALGEELFWGHDRLVHLAAALDGRFGESPRDAERMLARPMGVQRRG